MSFINLTQTFGSMDFFMAYDMSGCCPPSVPESASVAIAVERVRPSKTAGSNFLMLVFIKSTPEYLVSVSGRDQALASTPGNKSD
jgi:hypothetical protein